MRVSSLSFYSTALTGIRDQQSNIARLSQQIATGEKYLAAKDAPIETSRALMLADRVAVRTQYQANQTQAELTLSEEGTLLEEMSSALTTARGITMNTWSTDSTTRSQMSIQLANLYTHIKDLANAQDSAGNYIFAGHQTDTRPYSQSAVYSGSTPPQVTSYAGDAGTRETEIDTGRYMQTNDNLDTVMQSGMADDLLQTIDELAVALRDNTATQTDLNDAYAVFSTALANLSSIQSAVAGRQLELADVQASNKNLMLNDQDALTKLQEIDRAAAIIELQQRQVALQAAESTFGLTSQQSLFNYL